MARLKQPFLFSWRQIDAKSDIQRLKLVLNNIPDEKLMQHLEGCRGKGRNKYPIRAMWNAYIARIVFGHRSTAELIRELRRNAELREACGFDPTMGADAVPTPSAFSRFIKVLSSEAIQPLVQEIWDALLEQASELLPDLGERVAIDSKAIKSYGKPPKRKERDGRRDIDADWGAKKQMDKEGNPQVTRWYGYKAQILVDAKYELPLGYEVTKASVSDAPMLMPMMRELSLKHPEIAKRTKVLSADKGYDSEDNVAGLYDEFGISPVIAKREMWREERTRLLHPDTADNIVYDENGKVYCVCYETGEYKELAFRGFEKERKTLKYQCPVKAYGLECHSKKSCRHFCKSVRIHLDIDRRIFTPIARSSHKWKREYKRRTAVERVNARLAKVYGFDDHTIKGLSKMRLHLSVVLCIMLTLAVGHIKEKRRENIRSLFAMPASKVA